MRELCNAYVLERMSVLVVSQVLKIDAETMQLENVPRITKTEKSKERFLSTFEHIECNFQPSSHTDEVCQYFEPHFQLRASLRSMSSLTSNFH